MGDTIKLQGRMMVCRSNGLVEELRQGSHLSISYFADQADLANDLLQDMAHRLGLLLTAAQGSKELPADQVRICIEDVLLELRDGEIIPSYIQHSGDVFKNAESLPVLPQTKTALQLVPKEPAASLDSATA